MTTTGTLLHEMRHVQHRALCYVLRTSSIIMAAAFTLMLTGCRKELCYDHDLHGLNVRAHIMPEWELEWMRDYGISEIYDGLLDFASKELLKGDDGRENSDGLSEELLKSIIGQLTPVPGSGIASVAYHESGMLNTRHIDSTGGMLHLHEGFQDILFYNNDTEYIVFSGMDSYAEASASTRTRTRASYNASHEDEVTVNSPDMLFGAWVEDYEGVLAPVADTVGIQLRPLVYKYLIIFEVTKGIDLVQAAAGGIAGMAGQVYMQDGHTGSETVTVLFDDCLIVENYIISVVSSFGVPDFQYGSESYNTGGRTFGLNLTITLNSGKTVYTDFDITDQMSIQPRGGYISIDGIEITTEGGDGFFDVSVGDWGDEEEIDLPI